MFHHVTQFVHPAALNESLLAKDFPHPFGQGLGAVEHDQDRRLGVQAPFAQIGQEFPHQKWTPKFGPVAKLDFSGSAGRERTAEL